MKMTIFSNEGSLTKEWSRDGIPNDPGVVGNATGEEYRDFLPLVVSEFQSSTVSLYTSSDKNLE